MSCQLVSNSITIADAESFAALFAYIGPGAGIALVGSFLAVLIAALTAFVTLATWPIRWLVWTVRSRQARTRAKVGRVVVLGLDGLDPDLVEQFSAQGLLPHLAKLRDEGTYERLGTTWPAISPVAWSSFSTGTNPGKHSIFDFIDRSRTDYRPLLSSARIRPPRRVINVGRYRIPLGRSRVDGLRRSKPFWTVLGEAGIFSAVLRVPITFPPDRFRGVQLSAMCVPDLRGTQGTATLFCEEGTCSAERPEDLTCERSFVVRTEDGVAGSLAGPPNPLLEGSSPATLAFRVIRSAGGAFVMRIDGQKITLQLNVFSEWVTLKFNLAPGVSVRGACRFLLRSFDSPFELYCTPLNIHPAKPVMPISYPDVYAPYLEKKLGPFATLGLAEDTSSLSDGIIEEGDFLKQSYDIHAEREAMFFDALKTVSRGLVVCVFDAPDRIQHMFWRFQEPSHPAIAAHGVSGDDHKDVIRSLYIQMDELVGKVRARLTEDTAYMVVSDHGFKSFRRAVDLNAWLRERGYLTLKEGTAFAPGARLHDVDWGRTRAYAIGLAGIFLNLSGRENQGIVTPGDESRTLARQIAAELTGLRDEESGEVAIHEAVVREDVYRGPYVDKAPDVLVGYNVGYRVSWESANGNCAARVFSDNCKAWSGDHCMHPALVPGILFTNLRLPAREANIVDLAPTILELLGVSRPTYLDGTSLCGDGMEVGPCAAASS
jgi:predicted AlkP superfamily phosphohydrolase/phosphomutase